MTDWQPPRCEHGHIVLGCPESPCSIQDAYLAEHNKAVDAYLKARREEARALVRSLIGLPPG